MLVLFGATVFMSAALLLAVQPIFARMALPLLGGAPAVWSTAVVFYQTMLLAGYGYAHVSTRYLGLRRQVGLHTILMLVVLVGLPLAVPSGWVPPTEDNPIPWLLGVLTVGVGLPFFVVSTTGPLLQRWFAATDHPAAGDPYFLYAAGNAGSLVGLLSYPFLVEPYLTVPAQSLSWSIGYGLLVATTAACGLAVWGRASAFGGPPEQQTGERLTAWRRFRWVALALVPSSLMVSVTSYVTSDVAAVPLLWVVPLSLYLLSFVLAFARRQVLPLPLAQRLWSISVIPVVLAMSIGATAPIPVLMVLHLAAFFFAALVCHARIAGDRPAAVHLTTLYLWMAAGGALGGVFTALIAPRLFTSVVEYPLLVAATGVLGGFGWAASTPAQRRLDLLAPLGVGALALGLVAVVRQAGLGNDSAGPAAAYGSAAVVCFLLSRRPARFGLGLGAVLMVSGLTSGESAREIYAERSFFGIHRVTRDADGFHRLFHGTTLHGMQSLAPDRRREPLTYYHRGGPVGEVFAMLGSGFAKPVAAVGLGAGALACYGQPGQEWIFYEIDPVVVRIAGDRALFSCLGESPAAVRVVLGDARLSLARAPDHYFGLIVLDAYSSDSIPVHLITREAVALYVRKLQPGGLLAFHVSNEHLRLRAVVASLAHDAGLSALYREHRVLTREERAQGKSPSQWMVLARRPADLGRLWTDGRWEREHGAPAMPVWTDHHSSILHALEWRPR